MNSLYVSTCLLLLSFSVLATPNTLTYQGRIKTIQGTALEHNGVLFEFTITNPQGSCVIYRETSHALDMRNSGGVFDVAIGSGSKNYPTSAGFKLLDAFENSGIYNCEGGGTYSPVSDDKRLLRTQFFDGIGWRLISPDSEIRTVPFAAQSKVAQTAQKLGSLGPADLITKASIPVCPLGQYLRHVAPAGTFLCETPAVTGGNVTGNITGSAAGFTGLLSGDVSGTQISTSVDRIKGTPVINTGIAPGKVLKFDGTNWAPADDNSGTADAVTGVTANAPLSVSGSTAPVISLDDSGVAAGTFNKVTVNSKGLVTAGANVTATELPNLAGDVTSTAGLSNTKVEKIQNVSVASTTPQLGQVMMYDNGKWNIQYFGFEQLRSTVTGSAQMPTTCAKANKTLNWSAITDTFSCVDIAGLDAGAVTTGTIADDRLPASATLWQDGGSGKVYYNGGNVGIGIADPTEKLTVNGTIESKSGGIKFPDGTLQTTAAKTIFENIKMIRHAAAPFNCVPEKDGVLGVSKINEICVCDGDQLKWINTALGSACEWQNKRIVNVGTSKNWSDGSFAKSCNEYRNPGPTYVYTGDTGDGTYTIDPDGPGGVPPLDVVCDMTTDGGGWTRVFNGQTNDFETISGTLGEVHTTYVMAHFYGSSASGKVNTPGAAKTIFVATAWCGSVWGVCNPHDTGAFRFYWSSLTNGGKKNLSVGAANGYGSGAVSQKYDCDCGQCSTYIWKQNGNCSNSYSSSLFQIFVK